MACKCDKDEVRRAKFQAALKRMDEVLGEMDKVFERMDKKFAKMMYVNPVESIGTKCKKQKRQSNGRFA
jgi:hypothetical protein